MMGTEKLIFPENEKSRSSPEDDSVYKRLNRSKEFINDCFNESLKIETIARSAHLSPYHFIRVFKKVYNQTPHQYLTGIRIEKAKELLKRNDSSVTEVCFDVGFQSLGSFSTLFARNIGLSPSEFQKEYERKAFLSVRFPEKLIPGCYLFYFN